MKIALAFPGCHKRAGVERIMLECANFLARRSHRVTVYASEIEHDALEPSVTARELPTTKNSILVAAGSFSKAVSAQLRGEQYDVLGTFGSVSPPDGVLWVQSVHKAWLEISQATRGLKGRAKQLCNPTHPLLLHREHMMFGERRYRRLIALTPDVAADLQRLYGVPNQDIEILPNGFSATEFNPGNVQARRKEMRQKLGYQQNDHVIIFVANELERKGFGPLIEAVARLQDDTIKLLVAGAVDPSPYQSRLAELRLTARTKFVGASAKVADFYAAADTFALPTKYEAWGMVIVEAMACGLPAITSRTAGAAIAVQQGINGFLVDNPLDATEIATSLRRRMHELVVQPDRISDSVQEYSWDNILIKYESILATISSQSHQPTGVFR